MATRQVEIHFLAETDSAFMTSKTVGDVIAKALTEAGLTPIGSKILIEQSRDAGTVHVPKDPATGKFREPGTPPPTGVVSPPCCCNYGAAVSGEHPEFECFKCPIHGGTLAQAGEMCKRHTREAAGLDELTRADV